MRHLTTLFFWRSTATAKGSRQALSSFVPPASSAAAHRGNTTVTGSSSASASNPSATRSPGQSSHWSYGTVRPQPATKEPWDSLQGLLIGVRPTHPVDVFDDRPVALGHLLRKVSDSSYLVRFDERATPCEGGKSSARDGQPALTLDIGTRVTIRYDEGKPDAASTTAPSTDSLGAGERLRLEDNSMVMKGTVAKVNGDGTYILLMDSDEVELSVLPHRIIAREAPKKLYHSAKFLELVGWLRSCVHDPRDCEAIAFILFHRGWRVERLYLLEKVDLAQFLFISKMERHDIMEKAEWERDHHNVIRMLHRERVKDRDFRYALAKYKGTISCMSGILVVSYVFTANLRAYRRQQRAHQLKIAVHTLSKGAGAPSAAGANTAADEPLIVERPEEERLVKDVLNLMVSSHPRIVAFTGSSGSGKSILCRNAIKKEHIAAVYLDVHGTEDTLRCVVKALGVQNIEVCGDLLDFVAEALHTASDRNNDQIPALVIKLREGGSLEKVYRESVSLVSDYQACNILLEVPMEALTPSNVALPRLDFYYIPPFTRKQAMAYTQHLLDPLDLVYFVETVGTNSNDLDDLFAAVRQRGVDPVAYTSLKLMKAMRRLQAALGPPGSPARSALRQLASMRFADGLPDDTAENLAVFSQPALQEFILYDPVQDQWRFTRQVFHTAARCIIMD